MEGSIRTDTERCIALLVDDLFGHGYRLPVRVPDLSPRRTGPVPDEDEWGIIQDQQGLDKVPHAAREDT